MESFYDQPESVDLSPNGTAIFLRIFGAQSLSLWINQEPCRQFKAVLNETGIIIFSAAVQHSSMKHLGISYEDDSQGNALAAILDGKGVKFVAIEISLQIGLGIFGEAYWAMPSCRP